jgi:hypothetical protein
MPDGKRAPYHAVSQLTKTKPESATLGRLPLVWGGYRAMSALLELLFEGVVEIAGYVTARVLLPVATFGRVRCESLSENFTFRWHGFKRLPSGRIVVHHGTAAVIGVVFWIACIVGGVICWKEMNWESPGCTRPAVSSEMPPAAPRSAPC